MFYILDSVRVAPICSCEHETLTSSLGAHIAQTDRQTSTDGTEFMESALNTLIIALRAIRDQADSVLKKIEQLPQRRSLAWKCVACGYTKHFTRPALAEVAALCPKCGGTTFDPM
jgi:predicted nucleic-acid-binding Zn-ribbon protein